MLIRERLEQGDFSSGEQAVVDYILREKLQIRDMTTKEIAKEAFASPSTLVRIAHKMGFDGWNGLKEAFLKEETYLQSHFKGIDANLPFQRGDNIMSIAGKIGALRKEAIDDTQALLTHDDLQKALLIMRKASSIGLYAVSNNLLLGQRFQYNMIRIGKKVDLCPLQGEMVYRAYLAEKDACALVISYSGETPILLQAAEVLKKHKVPVIAVTNIGDNRLARMGDCVLRISTREKQYSKIATFTTDSAIAYLLDVLYSCIFAFDHEKNLQLKIDSARAIEQGRKNTTVDIIREN